MTEIIVPSYTKRSGTYEEMRARNPLDEEKVKFIDGILVPTEIYETIERAAALHGISVALYMISTAGMEAIYDLTGPDEA